MKLSAATNNILKLMSAADRKAMGVQDSREAMLQYSARSEKELQNQIAQLLRIRGLFFDQDAMHKRRTGTKSAPDFQFPYKGRYMAWEVKFGKGKLDEGQERVRDMIIAQGGCWALITSLEEARNIISS